MRLDIPLDRSSPSFLMEQISATLRDAVQSGQIAPGTRLPSWRDLATQLGVSRGTVRAALERLVDDQLIVSAGPAGTFVAKAPSPQTPVPAATVAPPMRDYFPTFSEAVMPFQIGVPAQDAFPTTLWARLGTRGARRHATAPTSYPDPRGEPALREAVAAYLAVARGIHAHADQIIVTNGYRTGLSLIIRGLGLEGTVAWMEEPGFPLARIALGLANIRNVPVRVDAEGLDVDRGIALAPDAALAIVTPSQQAPLGMPLSAERREKLLAWAKSADAWIVEDDYLGELQLDGRASPALAAADRSGRVIHIGTFSKSISPSLALGFVVVPPALAEHFGNVAAFHYPAPGMLLQHLVASFMTEGHFMRHLRKMKQLYRSRRDMLVAAMADLHPVSGGCLSILLDLDRNADDVEICGSAYRHRLAPAPLSAWYGDRAGARRGLLLCVTNCMPHMLEDNVGKLRSLVADRRPI